MKHELILTAKKELWDISLVHGTKNDEDPRMMKIIDKIFERDKYTCQFCGWRSKKYQEIHHLDHNHDNFNEKNLVTACPCCHQVFHLPSVSLSKGGVMIWLPEIPQNVLNNLCINLFMAMENPEMENMAKSIYIDLERRKDFVNQYISNNNIYGYDPAIFAEALIELQEHENIVSKFHENLRILPNPNKFKTQILHWVKEKKINNPEKSYFAGFEKQLLEKMQSICQNEENQMKSS